MAWGNKVGESVSAPVSSGGNAMSFIGGEVVITGNVTGQGDLHIDGTVEGDVAGNTVILGPSGTIKGNLVADRANVGGAVEGTVNAATLVIERTARVSGDLTYQNVSIENGAQVEGRLTQRNNAGSNVGELKLVNAVE
jgi:cytoskeletal protein CcmA (bactofilin family)